MNALLRGCIPLSLQSEVLCRRPLRSVSDEMPPLPYKTERYLPTPATDSSWIKRDSSEKKMSVLRSRAGGLNESTKTDWSLLNERREVRDG